MPICTLRKPTVTVIAPKTFQTKEEEKVKRRVAAYARVSTEQDEQQSSYEAQIKYYESFIKSNQEWEFVDIYSDEGISGTSTKKRDGFNRMMEDAKNGKMDLILTKSISRFARNTVDSLSAARKLKEYGVEIRFEKEGVSSFDSAAELSFTMFSSIAQEESRSISENVRWGHQRRMEAGKAQVGFSHFLGFAKGKDGEWVIVESEAKTVRDIFDMLLSGMTIAGIARELTKRGIKTPAGCDTWGTQTVNSILHNEKYKGDAMLQKSFTVDYLTKKVKKNNGERAMYYVRNHHPAIIDPDVFDLVQKRLDFMSKNQQQFRCKSPFAAKIICADCGTFFGHKIRRGKDIWYCNHKYTNDKNCNTPIIHETALKAFSMEALGLELARIAAGKGPRALTPAEEGSRAERLAKTRDSAREALDKAIKDFEDWRQKNMGDDESDFTERYDKAIAKIEDLKTALNLAQDAVLDNTARREMKRRFDAAVAPLSPESITFTDELFKQTIESITVSSLQGEKYTLEYHFTNGDKLKLTKATK